MTTIAVFYFLLSLIYFSCTNAGHFQSMRLIFDPTETSKSGVAVSRPHMFCYKGIWTVYSKTNLFHSPYDITCANSTGTWAGAYTYFGNRDLEVEQLELYGDIHFTNVFYSSSDPNANLFNNTRPLASYVLTGYDSWSLYELPDFKGRFFCIAPAKYFPYNFATDVRPQLYPFRIVQSVGKGCREESKLYFPMEIPDLL